MCVVRQEDGLEKRRVWRCGVGVRYMILKERERERENGLGKE